VSSYHPAQTGAVEVENNQRDEPTRQAAYQAGIELARKMAGHQSEVQPFSEAFFSQGKVVRQQTNQRKIHVINENEYIITETQFFSESQTFGDQDGK
jgi:hypothetical protein